MIKKALFSIAALILFVSGAEAQTVYSDPTPLQESSKDVKIYFNAKGTPLEGQSATAKIYAHTGYDTSSSQWNAAPSWGNNDQKYQLTYQEEDLWMLDIGDIRTYYNVPDKDVVTGLDFVFRVAPANSIQTKDLFLNVVASGLQLSLTSSSNGNIIAGETGYVTFKVNTTEPADITLSIDNETVATATSATYLEKNHTFVNPGEHFIVAEAEANGIKVSEEMKIYYLAESSQKDYPGGTPIMGPVKNSDGSVTFCIGAPLKNHVVLLGSWNNFEYSPSQVMNYQDTENGRYFWTTVQGLDNDTMYTYFFVVDGGEFFVGDPYARLVLDPFNDKYLDTNVFPGLPEYPYDAVNGWNVPVAVYQGSINDYDWKVKDFKGPDPSNLMIYELLFRDFTGTEGKANGNGTVRQAMEKLDYLKQLGINAIELLPIMEFTGNNSWGYNPNFYFAPDKAYGTPDDYKEFIDLCHQNGIAVILDMVFNQSDGLHPWYQMYQPAQNPFYNLDAPHAYSVLNDWNQGMPMVQQQWKDVIEYWLTEYNFDGFRFDLVKGLGLNNSYASNSSAATDAYNASRVAEMAYLNSVIQAVKPGGYCINENLAGSKEENEMAEDGELNWANVNNEGRQFAKGLSSNSSLNRMYAPLDSRLVGSTVSYLESHDEERLAYDQKTNGVSAVKNSEAIQMQRLGCAAAQMIMAPGAHMIWMFSELGNSQTTKTSIGNDTGPKIVNWGLLDNPYHKGLYDTYCELNDIRNQNPQFFTNSEEPSINCGASNWNNGRSILLTANNGTEELYTFINPKTTGSLTMNNIPFKYSDNENYQIMSKTYESEPSFNAATGSVTIPANSYVVIGSKDLKSAGIDDLKSDANAEYLKAYGGIGEIIVEYAVEPVIVYSINGGTIGRLAKSGNISAQPGIYLVKSGKHIKKVVVK